MENKNIDKILENVKENIAISEFGKEFKKKKTNNSINIKKVAIIFLTIGILAAGGTYAVNRIYNFANRNPIYMVQSISDAITDGYVENLNADYLYSDGVGLKIDSFFMSENNINLVFNFKLNDETKLDEKNIEFAYILYNENNEVYHVEKGTNTNLEKEFIREKGIELENNNIEPYFESGQLTYITKTNENIVISSLISAKDYFPKAKKLYIKIVGIGYKTDLGFYKSLSNSEWNIEIDVPEKFYSENPVEYDLKNNNGDIKIEHLMVTNTSTTLIANISEINNINNKISISIIDRSGNEYETRNISFTGDRITCLLPLRKANLTNKMYLKININGEEKIEELKAKEQ